MSASAGGLLRARGLGLAALLGVAACKGGDAKGADVEPSDAIFDRARVHQIDITVPEAYLDALATDLDARVPCTFTFDGERVEGVGIRQKGNAAIALAGKPSFSMKLDEFHDGLTLHGLDKLILNGEPQDPTLLRELLATDAHARAGLPVARVTHATLSFNGVDHGIYVVSEAIDETFLRRNFGKKYDQGNLYEGPCCGDFVPDVSQLDLKDEKSEGRSRDDVKALAAAITDAADGDFEAAVGQRLDLERYLRGYALEALLGHWDGYAFRGNNYYLYDDPRDARFEFLPHGMDRVLEDARFDPETTPIARLPLRIRAIPKLDAALHAEMALLRDAAVAKATMLATLDERVALLHGAKAGAQTASDLDVLDQNVPALRAIIVQRAALLDPSIVCGDGVIAGLETCDDGNTTGGDGCSAHCRTEP